MAAILADGIEEIPTSMPATEELTNTANVASGAVETADDAAKEGVEVASGAVQAASHAVTETLIAAG